MKNKLIILFFVFFLNGCSHVHYYPCYVYADINGKRIRFEDACEELKWWWQEKSYEEREIHPNTDN